MTLDKPLRGSLSYDYSDLDGMTSNNVWHFFFLSPWSPLSPQIEGEGLPDKKGEPVWPERGTDEPSLPGTFLLLGTYPFVFPQALPFSCNLGTRL